MANKGKPSRNDLRKVRTILSLVGNDGSREVASAITNTSYRRVKDFHVYVSRDAAEGNDFHLSIWDQPKESLSSRCLFADRMSTTSFYQSLNFWRTP